MDISFFQSWFVSFDPLSRKIERAYFFQFQDALLHQRIVFELVAFSEKIVHNRIHGSLAVFLARSGVGDESIFKIVSRRHSCMVHYV